MPAAPRIKGKATKIVFSILGTPDNLKDKKSARQREIDRRLVFDYTSRVR